jgi:hypothetical protein
VSIAGLKFSVKTWRDVLLKTCEFAEEKSHSDFSRILGLKGSKRLWFSLKPKELKDPIPIGATGIFAETNVNANGLVLRSLHVLNLFGLEPRIDVTFKK